MSAPRVARRTPPQPASSSPTQAILGILIGMLIAAIGVLSTVLVFLIFSTHASPPAVAMVASTTAFISGIPDTGQLLLASQTPYQPQTYTPTASSTPTASPTATATVTPTPTATETPTVTPTNTPVPPTFTPSDGLPAEASVTGVEGNTQSLPLSCEARSAVDWARYFGVHINEMDFQYALPVTDNPNTGFVGNPDDERGNLPPDSYGVHAPPVAVLLRAYGLNANSYSNLSFLDLRREIASGQPVIAWVIGNTWRGEGGTLYTASDGQTMTVAPFEHTVIIIGYTPDSVTVVDGSMIYTASIDRFLSSWMVLENQAVIME